MRLPEFLGPQRGHLDSQRMRKDGPQTHSGHGYGGNAFILSAVQHAIGAAHLARTLIARTSSSRGHCRGHGHFPVPELHGASSTLSKIHCCRSPACPRSAGMSATFIVAAVPACPRATPRTCPRTRALCSDPRTPRNIFEARPQVRSNETDQDSMQYACSVRSQGPVPPLHNTHTHSPNNQGHSIGFLLWIFVHLCWIT